MPIKDRKAIKKTDIAWLAGIIDGEGCIMIKPQHKQHHHLCRVLVTNTDEGILCEVKRIPREWLVFYTIGRTNSNSINKPCYHIEINRQLEAKFVLEKVLPYLKSVKQQRANMFLEYLKQKKRRDGKAFNCRKKVMQYSYLRL